MTTTTANEIKTGDHVIFGLYDADLNTRKFNGTIIARKGNKIIINTQYGDRESNLTKDFLKKCEFSVDKAL